MLLALPLRVLAENRAAPVTTSLLFPFLFPYLLVAYGFALGIPVSKSHALLAGLAGAGLAGGGWSALQWTGWQKVGIGLICSLGLGFCGAFLIGF